MGVPEFAASAGLRFMKGNEIAAPILLHEGEEARLIVSPWWQTKHPAGHNPAPGGSPAIQWRSGHTRSRKRPAPQSDRSRRVRADEDRLQATGRRAAWCGRTPR